MVNSITFSHAAASLGYESVPVVYHNYLVIEETVGSFTKDNKLLCASNYHCGVLGKSSIARNRLPYIVRFHIIEQAIWQVYFVRDLHKSPHYQLSAQGVEDLKKSLMTAHFPSESIIFYDRFQSHNTEHIGNCHSTSPFLMIRNANFIEECENDSILSIASRSIPWTPVLEHFYIPEDISKQTFIAKTTEELLTDRGNLTATYGFSMTSQNYLQESTGIFLPRINTGSEERLVIFQALSRLMLKGLGPHWLAQLNKDSQAKVRQAMFASQLGDDNFLELMIIGMNDDERGPRLSIHMDVGNDNLYPYNYFVCYSTLLVAAQHDHFHRCTVPSACAAHHVTEGPVRVWVAGAFRKSCYDSLVRVQKSVPTSSFAIEYANKYLVQDPRFRDKESIFGDWSPQAAVLCTGPGINMLPMFIGPCGLDRTTFLSPFVCAILHYHESHHLTKEQVTDLAIASCITNTPYFFVSIVISWSMQFKETQHMDCMAVSFVRESYNLFGKLQNGPGADLQRGSLYGKSIQSLTQKEFFDFRQRTLSSVNEFLVQPKKLTLPQKRQAFEKLHSRIVSIFNQGHYQAANDLIHTLILTNVIDEQDLMLFSQAPNYAQPSSRPTVYDTYTLNATCHKSRNCQRISNSILRLSQMECEYPFCYFPGLGLLTVAGNKQTGITTCSIIFPGNSPIDEYRKYLSPFRVSVLCNRPQSNHCCPGNAQASVAKGKTTCNYQLVSFGNNTTDSHVSLVCRRKEAWNILDTMVVHVNETRQLGKLGERGQPYATPIALSEIQILFCYQLHFPVTTYPFNKSVDEDCRPKSKEWVQSKLHLRQTGLYYRNISKCKNTPHFWQLMSASLGTQRICVTKFFPSKPIDLPFQTRFRDPIQGNQTSTKTGLLIGSPSPSSRVLHDNSFPLYIDRQLLSGKRKTILESCVQREEIGFSGITPGECIPEECISKYVFSREIDFEPIAGIHCDKSISEKAAASANHVPIDLTDDTDGTVEPTDSPGTANPVRNEKVAASVNPVPFDLTDDTDGTVEPTDSPGTANPVPNDFLDVTDGTMESTGVPAFTDDAESSVMMTKERIKITEDTLPQSQAIEQVPVLLSTGPNQEPTDPTSAPHKTLPLFVSKELVIATSFVTTAKNRETATMVADATLLGGAPNCGDRPKKRRRRHQHKNETTMLAISNDKEEKHVPHQPSPSNPILVKTKHLSLYKVFSKLMGNREPAGLVLLAPERKHWLLSKSDFPINEYRSKESMPHPFCWADVPKEVVDSLSTRATKSPDIDCLKILFRKNRSTALSPGEPGYIALESELDAWSFVKHLLQRRVFLETSICSEQKVVWRTASMAISALIISIMGTIPRLSASCLEKAKASFRECGVLPGSSDMYVLQECHVPGQPDVRLRIIMEEKSISLQSEDGRHEMKFF